MHLPSSFVSNGTEPPNTSFPLFCTSLQSMLDPFGEKRMVFPRLLAFIADLKERWELVCLYGSVRVNRPCPTCCDSKGAIERKICKIIEGRQCVDSRCNYCYSLAIRLWVSFIALALLLQHSSNHGCRTPCLLCHSLLVLFSDWIRTHNVLCPSIYFYQ